MDMTSAHVNVVKWSNVVVDRPGERPHSGKGDEKRDRRQQQPATGRVRNMPVQQIAHRRAVQQQENESRRDTDKYRDDPAGSHAVTWDVTSEKAVDRLAR